MSFDFNQTIISQYANSPILKQLITNFAQYIGPDANITAFYNFVWNVDTAQGPGLDVWGRIVGVGRVLQVAAGKYLGFDEATNVSADPFNQSPFWAGISATSNYALSDSAFRVLILAKALANISDGSIPAINQLLINLFPGRGNTYVQEAQPNFYLWFDEAIADPAASPFNQAPFYSGSPFGVMQMTYVFEFVLTQVETAIITQSGVLPTPVGVSATFAII